MIQIMSDLKVLLDMFSNFSIAKKMGFPQMEVLFLTAHLPYPPASGGRRREFELISRLGKYFKIHLCSITFEPEVDNLNSRYLEPYCASISLFRISNPTRLNGHNTQGRPWLMNRYYSEEGVHRIYQLLKDRRLNLVHLEGYYLMQLLPIDLDLPVVLVEHNIEYSLDLQRTLLSRSSEDFLSNWREYYCTFLWERIFWRRATKVITLTAEDKTTIRRVEPKVDVQLIPNGIDHEPSISKPHSAERWNTPECSGYLNKQEDGKCPFVLFVCNFAYEPNVDAALYFSNSIFPLILNRVPNTILFLVGNSPPSEVSALMNTNYISSHIKVTGYVESLDPFYKAAQVVVCPLRIGGGIKMKILEALKAGKAIVSTSVGAQGLTLNNRALCICDKVSDFANNVIRLLINPHERYLQEQEALRFGRTFPTWEQIAEEYLYCYSKTVPTIY
jgi:glycosyltransferase involved in cell wall biosynthesis